MGREQIFPDRQSAETKVETASSSRCPSRKCSRPAAAPKALQTRSAVLGSTPRVKIQTPSLQGSINLKGAQIDDLAVRQRETIAKNSPPVRLLSPLGAPGAYIASFGWTGQGAQVPTSTRCGPRTASR